MSNISKKTVKDLEFATVLEEVASLCHSELGKEKARGLHPHSSLNKVLPELQKVNEYLSSFINDNKIPNHFFDDIQKEIHLLKIENSYLEPESFLKVASNSNTIHELVKFFKKFKAIYPILFADSEKLSTIFDLTAKIQSFITPFGEVSDTASSELKQIRREISQVRAKISESFTSALSSCQSHGYLDDIKETVVEHQRVLAVLAMHRRKVKGRLLGSSKSGNIVYIAPASTEKYHRELENLIFDERQEVIRVLRELTAFTRDYSTEIQEHYEYLIDLDVVGAKAKYAHRIEACLPTISTNKKVFLKDAYHPILLEKNKENNTETIPQTLSLHPQQRIIMISGPNAGGKSITLKTMGLLQVMLQSGLLIPVDERSETFFFQKILTDIGDNQSIENQLSTYSYRIKNMRHFLQKCNKNTLFLIDEFGTGSDPELGGALAEIFLEEFYDKKAYGIITTHYANLKVLANELDNVVNANMQFDERSLQPLFKLVVGQAGSSFTFEVAQKNGIPYRLINRAKKRVETEKIRLDKTISRLQKERNKLQKTAQHLEQEKSKAVQKTDDLETKTQKVQEKLEGFQELYDHNQKMLQYGRAINEMINRYFQTNRKKQLNTEFAKWVQAERTKFMKKNPPQPKTKKAKKEQKNIEIATDKKLKSVEKKVLTEVKKVRVKKKKEEAEIAKQKASYVFKINDKVRIDGSRACGTIKKIEKKTVFINYGIFTTQATVDKLILVEKAKK